MAHFSELDENDIVVRVVVVSNDDILDENGVEQEHLGIEVCNRHVGQGRWIQTSYNNNFRKQFGEVGCIYNHENDLFHYANGPFPSWVLDDNFDWQAPVAQPTDGRTYYWDEDTITWVVDEQIGDTAVEIVGE